MSGKNGHDAVQIHIFFDKDLLMITHVVPLNL